MGIRLEIENEQEVRAAMLATEGAVAEAVDQVRDDYTEKVYREMRHTSPVRTGTYKSNWSKEKDSDGARLVTNDTEYGPYLVWPNQHMIGSPKADKPGPGIIHNVRGRIKKMRAAYSKEMITKVNGVLEIANK